MTAYPENDKQYQDGIVKAVDGQMFEADGGWWLGLQKDGAQPRVGGTADAVREFAALDYDDQVARVPDLDRGHSGNTFGMAVRLAHHYLTDHDLVWQDHAAIAALVGCDEAGCPPVIEGAAS